MTPKKIKNEIREKTDELESWIKMSESSDEMKKTYSGLIETYQKQIQELEDQLTSQGKKSKGNIDKSIFVGKPFLTVSIDKSYIKRNLYDSIRKSWLRVSDERCEKLVEEKGYVVGVIESVVIGVIQVSGWKIIKEGDNEGRVEFEGELLSDHPSIDFTLKDRTVSGPIQYFNYPDDWTD